MPESSFLGLAQNISLLLALVVVFDSLGAHPLARPAFVRQAASGVLLGGIGVVVMLTSWVLSPGVVFDTRSVLLGISGLFFGPLPTTIAMALTAALRLYQGGSGAFTGVLVILATGTLGLAWRQLRKQPLEKTNWQELYLFGLVSHLVMLALMLTLPWETAQRVLANISLPVLTLYPLGTVLLGILLTNRLRRETLQAALHQTTARLNATQQLSKIGGWDWDVARQSMFWTEETYRLHGFSPAEFPPGSTDHIQQSLACYDPTDRPVVQAAFQHCAEQGRPYNLELRFTPRGGEQMWIRTQAEAVVERGQVVRVVGNFMDITERKQAEAAQRESELQLASIINHSRDAIGVSLQGRHMRANPAYVALFGYDREAEVLEKSVLDLIAPARRPDILANVQRRARGEAAPVFYETRGLRKNGAEFDMEVTVSTYALRSKFYTVVIIRDITERKQAERQVQHQNELLQAQNEELRAQQEALQQAEAALRESEERYALALNGAGAGLWDWDMATDRVVYSAQWKQMLGYEDHEVENAFSGWKNLWHPDDSAQIEKAIEDYLAGKTAHYEIVHRCRHKNGAWRWMLTRGDLLRDARQKPVRWVGTNVDITERVQVEEALRASEAAVRNKLRALLEPGEAIGALSLGDILDREALQTMLEDFYRLTGIGSAVLDLSGQVLVAVGWQAICTQFHRVHPGTLKNCLESDLGLASGTPAGTFKAYRCRNNLWDVVTPIEVGGRHLGNIYLGQFFYAEEVPDRELFRSQARQYGFDETAYLAALDRVPRWSRETVEAAMAFYAKLAGMISALSYSTVKLSRALSQKEQALRDLEAGEKWHRLVLQTAPDGYMLVDTDGRLLEVNEAYGRMSGYSAPELLGLQVSSLEAAESAADTAAHIQKLMTQGAERFESRHRRKDGSAFDVEISAQYQPDAGGRFVVFLRDITERKQAEVALRESEERFKALHNASFGGIAVHDKGRILECNQGLSDMMGYSLDELLGGMDGLLLIAPTSREFVRNNIITGYEKPYEAFGLRKNGEIFPMRLEARNIPYKGRNVRTVEFRDITERKQADAKIQANQAELQRLLAEAEHSRQTLLSLIEDQKEAEEQVRQLNAELEQRVETRTAELNAANAELSQANAALVRVARLKDEFLASMSHELRTPLTAVLGLAESLQMGVYGPLTDKQIQMLGTVRASGEHLLALITDILDLSKLEAGKLDLQFGPVAVGDICQASLLLIKPQAVKKNQRLSLALDQEVDVIEADARRLKQMLVNLLGNAAKFTPAGGELGLRVEGDVVRQVVRFSVWDTGIGIAPADQARLFQSFVQLDSRLAREYEGTGLGLALVRRLVELHGGQVTVESAGAGQGSTFTLTLPWPAAGRRRLPEPAAEAPTQPARSGAGQLVLVAEDNEVSLTVLADFLGAWGYQVAIARDGAEALAEARRLRPALILMDAQMPVLDGLEAIRQLRADPDQRLAATPVLALTALAMVGDRERCLAAGADGYLGKPMNLAQLTQALNQLLPPDRAAPPR